MSLKGLSDCLVLGVKVEDHSYKQTDIDANLTGFGVNLTDLGVNLASLGVILSDIDDNVTGLRVHGYNVATLVY